jgi:prolyl 4-hydroxylase
MLDFYSRNHKAASVNIGKYLENPIHAFQMIKRVTSDWVEVEKLVTYDNMMGKSRNNSILDHFHLCSHLLEMIHNISYQKSAYKFATEEDLHGAATAIIHLQDVYQLNTTEISLGILNGVDYKSNMTSSDCFEMGKQAFKTGDYNASIDWLRLAKTFSDAKNKTDDSDLKENILEFLLRSLQHEGHMVVALNLTQEYLKLNPKDAKAKYNKEMIEEDIRRFGKRSEAKSLKDLKLVRSKGVDEYLEMCRGGASADMSLTCNYESSNTPFLKLAPLKVEVLHKAPQILMFHDVLSNKEIGLLKKQAKPPLERSKVFNVQTNRTENSSKRLSKEARIESKKNEPVTIIGERVAAMTGLSLVTAEELQLANYGVGGYYEAHHDFVSASEQAAFEAPVSGNRVATVLFYVSMLGT